MKYGRHKDVKYGSRHNKRRRIDKDDERWVDINTREGT